MRTVIVLELDSDNVPATLHAAYAALHTAPSLEGQVRAGYAAIREDADAVLEVFGHLRSVAHRIDPAQPEAIEVLPPTPRPVRLVQP